MARIKLALPEQVKFTTDIPIRISDVNYGGHVGNDAILTIMHEVRLQFFNYLGYKDEVALEDSIGIIVADAAIVYKSESFYGDVLEARLFVDDYTSYGFDIFYLFINKASGAEVARGKTGIVCFDYEAKKLSTVPTNLKAKLN